MLGDAFRRLTRHSLVYALGPALQKALAFLLLPVVTAYIGTTAEYGVVELAAVTVAVMAQVLGINLLHGMTRYYHEYDDERERARLVTTSLWLLLASTGGFLLLVVTLRGPAARLLFGSAEHAPALVVTAAILVCQSLVQGGLRWLQMLERSLTYGVVTTVKMLVEIGLKLWFLIGLGLAAMGVLYSVLAGEVLALVGLGGLLVVRLGLGFSWPMARRLLAYSWPLFLSGLAMFALHQSDRWVVLHVQGEDAVGLYGLGYKLGSLVNLLLLEAFGLIWFPLVFSIRDEERTAQLCRVALTAFNALMCFLSLLLALFHGEIAELMLDASFREARTAIVPVALGYVAWGVFQIVHTVFYVRERTGLVSLLVALAAALNLASNLVVVPRWGYAGAAWTTAGCFAVLALLAWRLAERALPVGFERGRVAVAIGLAVALYLAGTALAPSEPWAAALFKLAVAAGFPAGLWWSGYLRTAEKDKIRAWWNEVRAGARAGRPS